jgi:D-glycero-D-manno-heptose 1,7-bisphosphate phosphatase
MHDATTSTVEMAALPDPERTSWREVGANNTGDVPSPSASAGSTRLAPAIFLSLSSSLHRELLAIADVSRFVIPLTTIRGIRLLYHAGYRIIVISSASAGPYTDSAPIDQIDLETELRRLLDIEEISLTAFYSWSERERKKWPESESRDLGSRTIESAALDNGIDLQRSWVVGELLDEVEAGRRAGCGTILIDNGIEPSWDLSSARTPDFIVADLSVAAESLVGGDES